MSGSQHRRAAARRRGWVAALAAGLVLAAGTLLWPALTGWATAPPDLTAFLEQHFRLRAAALISGDAAAVAAQIDPGTVTGRWLVQREQDRIAHVHQWARARGYTLAAHEAEVKILRARGSGATARASVIFRLGLGYRPQAQPDALLDWMGVGTSHVVDLVRTEAGWRVARDYALDPLYENGPPPGVEAADYRHSPPPELAGLPAGPDSLPAAAGGPLNRAAAAQYAHTYCGIAWGCGNGNRYNRSYRDFTGVGGDCANFASQVLYAGGLRPRGGWRYDQRRREASAAWINAGALVRYMIGSGRGQLLARGTLDRVDDAAGGVQLKALQPGDLIGYEQKGDIVHVSVVTGADSQGYTVVNSHTADRHRVPWDLGWGAQTRFWLVRIRS